MADLSCFLEVQQVIMKRNPIINILCMQKVMSSKISKNTWVYTGILCHFELDFSQFDK